MARLKPYLRWLVLGGTLFFLAKNLKDHWQEVVAIRISGAGWVSLAFALAVTLLAHIWCGWVWGWILREFNQPIQGWWSIQVYLKTNIAKYLPGNVWHFYGRVRAAQAVGVPLAVASLSVLMEPLLMAAAALLVTLLSFPQASWAWQLPILGLVLMVVHPRVLNPLVEYLGKLKGKAKGTQPVDDQMILVKRYPLRPLLGELCFLALRGIGFLLTMLALKEISLVQIPLLLSAFSLAWLLGLVIPGAPGGLGVFEATALALLEQQFASGIVLSTVALYRLVSIVAEAGGAGLAWLGEIGINRSRND
ncbi:UPF0104 family protein [Lyngbya aestuarii]|uniref:UPF0104 family protein n=1 Tax=Lyngbya aestuarii TaxID=118322 RepID=UPI00403D835D